VILTTAELLGGTRDQRERLVSTAGEGIGGAEGYGDERCPDDVLPSTANVKAPLEDPSCAGEIAATEVGEVQVIDDDLGRTGDGGAARPGGDKLLAAICEGRVGAVLAIEASRLARNGREWHTLLEFCGVVDTLIIDEDGIYDPGLPNDRLLLGMKGTMSEMELSILRQRAGEARKQKARRGELFANVAIGYVKTDDDRIEKEPDRRVQEAIAVVFEKFTELQSARQVFLWMIEERILLPAVTYIAGKRSLEWRAPSYRTVYHILTNPVYSGAYAFGRRSVEVKIQNGRKRTVRNRVRHWKDWDVLIKDHHEGYIPWEEFERNQCLLADNANRRSNMGRGLVRRGEALLAGLFRCARCGKKLQVSYSGNPQKQRYVCPGPNNDTFGDKCISFGGLRTDRAVAQEVLGRVQPLGIEAAWLRHIRLRREDMRRHMTDVGVGPVKQLEACCGQLSPASLALRGPERWHCG